MKINQFCFLFLWQCSLSAVAESRFLRKNGKSTTVTQNLNVKDLLPLANPWKNGYHPAENLSKHSARPRNLQPEEATWEGNATFDQVSLGELMSLPDLAAEEMITFTLGPAPEDAFTAYVCYANSTTGDIDVVMTLAASQEVQCRQLGSCGGYANPGDEYLVTVSAAATSAQDIVLECASVTVEAPFFASTGQGPGINMTAEEEAVYAVSIEQESSLMCEVRSLVDGKRSWRYDVKLTVPFVGGAECAGYGSEACALHSQGYSGYVLVEIYAMLSVDNEAGVLVCASSETEDLVLDRPVPLEIGVLRSFEYVVQDDISRLECGVSGSASIVMSYKTQAFDSYQSDYSLEFLAKRNITVLVHALASEVEENEELECTLLTWDVISLEANVPTVFIFNEWETKAFQFATTDLAPSEVFCEMIVVDGSPSASVGYRMANLGNDGKRTEIFGTSSIDGINFDAIKKGWGPNHLGTWYVIADYAPGFPSRSGEIQVTCGYNRYDKLVNGEAVEFMVETGINEHVGYHFEVEGPSSVVCSLTTPEPMNGTFDVMAAEDFQVDGELYSSQWFSDVDASCFEFLNELTYSECDFSTDGPSDAVLIVENQGDTNATGLSIMCTATALEGAAVERTNDLFD